MTKSLYTTKDVKEVRDKLSEEQLHKDKMTGLDLPSDQKVLDHCHKTMRVRGVLHRQSNSALGKLEGMYTRYLSWWYTGTLSDFLRQAAEYLEQTEQKPDERWYHPHWLKKVQTKFNSLREQQKDRVLILLGGEAGKNTADRKKKFKELINNRQFGYDLIQAIIKQESSQVKINEQEGNKSAVSKD